MRNRGFTLIEILATLLLLAFGLVAVVGMVQYASRLSAESQTGSTALATARTVLLNPQPARLVADPGDSNGDDWWANGPVSAPPTGDYSFVVHGWLNGYYLRREERSRGGAWPTGDEIDARNRWATITVTLYAGGKEAATLQRRLLRRTGP